LYMIVAALSRVLQEMQDTSIMPDIYCCRAKVPRNGVVVNKGDNGKAMSTCKIPQSCDYKVGHECFASKSTRRNRLHALRILRVFASASRVVRHKGPPDTNILSNTQRTGIWEAIDATAKS